MNTTVSAAVAVVTAIVGLAIVAVLVGSQNTSTIISSAGTSLSSIINAAVGPATGSSNNLFGSSR